MKRLFRLSAEQLVLHPDVLKPWLRHLPTSIHKSLFTVAVAMVSHQGDVTVQLPPSQSYRYFDLEKYGSKVKATLKLLVSTWPGEVLSLSDYLHATRIVSCQLTEGLLEGLLHLQPDSPLTLVDAQGFLSHRLFRLPLHALSHQKRLSSQTLKLIQERCGCFFEHGSDDTWESVLSWKLTDEEEDFIAKVSRTQPVKIILECEVVLTDWLTIVDELIGLAVQDMTQFELVVTKVTVDNYHMNQVNQLHGLLKMVNTQDLRKLVVNGKRRAVDLMMWEMAEDLKKLKNITMFGLGTSGPRMYLPGTKDPDKASICLKATEFLSQWSSLNELYFIGITLTNHMGTLLTCLENPLMYLTVHGCGISHDDIQALAASKHISNLRHLGLEYNKLSGCGPALHNALSQAANLRLLNVRETYLNCDDKLTVMSALCDSRYLATLVMYENDTMLTMDNYKELIDTACQLPVLKEFYLFPFNYQVLEKFYRKEIDNMIDKSLSKYHKTISFFY